jgi:hypothetical protein
MFFGDFVQGYIFVARGWPCLAGPGRPWLALAGSWLGPVDISRLFRHFPTVSTFLDISSTLATFVDFSDFLELGSLPRT